MGALANPLLFVLIRSLISDEPLNLLSLIRRIFFQSDGLDIFFLSLTKFTRLLSESMMVINGILLIDQFDTNLGESDDSIIFTAEHPEPLVAEQLTERKTEPR